MFESSPALSQTDRRIGRCALDREPEHDQKLVQAAVPVVGVEHPPRELRRCAPGSAAEEPGDPLPGTQAVEACTARESVRSELIMNRAPRVPFQILARCAGRLIEAESLVRIKGGSNAAQCTALGAVCP